MLDEDDLQYNFENTQIRKAMQFIGCMQLTATNLNLKQKQTCNYLQTSSKKIK